MSSALFVALLLASLVALSSAQKQLVLALEDEFTDFNLSLWKHELTLGGGGNWEFQAYDNSRTNSFTEDGVLHIHPTLLADIIGDANVRGGWFRYDFWGASPADLCTGNAFYGCERTSGAGGNYLNPIVSARIRTAESFSFTYGKVEVRARLPIGDWLWPAIWLLPTDNQYGRWPASGEMDIMESRGNPPSYSPGGYDVVGSTLHWGPDFSQNKFELTHQTKNGTNWTDDFHTYGFIWNESYIGTYIDEESNVVLSVKIDNQSFWERGGLNNGQSNPWRGRGNNAPFDRRFYLILNLAVGGTTGFFPDVVNVTKPWSNTSPHSVNEFYDDVDTWWPTWTQDFEIDSVRVWTYQETTSPSPSPSPQCPEPSPSPQCPDPSPCPQCPDPSPSPSPDLRASPSPDPSPDPQSLDPSPSPSPASRNAGARVESTVLTVLYHPGLTLLCLILTAAFFML